LTDNAHALFVRATYLSCHRLISSWKTDLNVSLAALELLSGLARMHIKESGREIEWKFVELMFEFVTFACSEKENW
jgi:hypothetical protein